MSRETRIGLLVGLLFIIGFAVVLSQLNNSGRSSPAADNSVAIANSAGADHPFNVLDVNDGTRPAADCAAAPASPPPAAPERDGSAVVSLGARPSPAPGPVSVVPDSPVSPGPASPTGGGVETRRLDGSTEALMAAADRSGVPLQVVAPPGRIPDDGAAAASAPPPGSVIYEVKQDDNLYTIAKQHYGPAQVGKWTLIKDANKVNPSKLRIGMKLVIPPLPAKAGAAAGAMPPVTTRPAAPESSAPLTPVIEPPPRVEVVMRPTRLTAEDPAPSPVTPATVRKYVVRNRDTLYNIARQSGTTVDKLIAINRIKDPKGLRVGTELTLPG